MKKIFLSLMFFVLAKVGYSQFPNNQTMGNDSTLITAKAALRSRVVNLAFTDTTAANITHIDEYAGAQIFTTSDTTFWLRSVGAHKWISLVLNVPASSTTPSNVWQVGGNFFNIIPSAGLRIGSYAPWGGAFTIMTNGVDRLTVPDLGVLPFSASDDSILVRNTAGEIGTIAKAGIATPTWQQTLTAGSTLTGGNTIVTTGSAFNITGLTNVPGTKALRYNSSTGLISYADTSTASLVSVRRSIEKGTGDSLQLENDLASPGNNYIYGTDSNGVKGYHPAVVVKLTNPAQGDILQYNADSSYFENISNLSYYVLQFETGVTTNAPVAGDSTFTRDTLIGKYLKIYREGELLTLNDTLRGYTIDSSIGKVTIHGPLSVNEQIVMQVYTSWPTYSSFPAPTAASWVDITPLGASNGIITESPAGVFTANGSSWVDYAVSTLKLPAGEDGGFIIQIVASTGIGDQQIGFVGANSAHYWTAVDAGVYFSYTGGSPDVYKMQGGALAVLTGGTVQATAGEYWGVFRVGSTITIRKNSTKSTTISDWTVIDTLTYSSSADLFLNINPNNGHTQKTYYPQGLNIQ